MLRFEQVRVQFGRTVVIQDLNFTVATGETVGIVGESGSGKTLTALAAMMLLPPNAQVNGSTFGSKQTRARWICWRLPHSVSVSIAGGAWR